MPDPLGHEFSMKKFYNLRLLVVLFSTTYIYIYIVPRALRKKCSYEIFRMKYLCKTCKRVNKFILIFAFFLTSHVSIFGANKMHIEFYCCMFEYYFDYFCILINLINELGFKEKSNMGESFRIIPEFRTLRLTFHRKSASKC